MVPRWNYHFSMERLSINPFEADLLDLFKSNRRVALSDANVKLGRERLWKLSWDL